MSDLNSVALPNSVDASRTLRSVANRSPAMFAFLFATWIAALAWFGPRLIQSMDAANGPISFFAQAYFVVFVCIAWLYGLYNISVVTFAVIAKSSRRNLAEELHVDRDCTIPVAVLYTTCNDFVEAGAASCVRMEYRNFKVYILDDSSEREYQRRVDKFAAANSNVQVVRRENRKGFKAGNLNHALKTVVSEPYFVIADSDEILPRNFLSKLTPRIAADRNCGFIQANHQCLKQGTKLQRDMCRGIDIHWEWYQPLRNKYGFVMFLGHGAILRTSCWDRAGGFPELVSEDLAYAIAIREQGYYGEFASDVVCMEEFPSSVRAFRIRHVKWTRGTCEFLHRFAPRLIRSRNISWTEKLDILFPTANLPLTLFFFVFMMMTAIVLPMTIGERTIVTFETGLNTLRLPVIRMPEAMNVLYTWDFYAMTLVALVSPLLCFILAMRRTPVKLLRFLVHSTALYATLAPLSTICVVGYLKTRAARFLVTGDSTSSGFQSSYWAETHPDSEITQRLEWVAAWIFLGGAIVSFNIALFGLAIGYALFAIMHNADWGRPGLQTMTWAPFSLIATGICLGGMSLFSMQPVFFGYGFHF